MKKIILLLINSILLFSNNNIELKLDTHGHEGIIRDIIVTKNKNIITASDDKTIKIWNSKTGKEIRKILGETSKGSEGKIFAIALSNNEKYLATGGYFVGNNSEKISAIRIYDYKTGKLLQILKGHTNTIQDLSFDKNNKYLISCGHDGEAKIWDVNNNFKLKDTLKIGKKSIKASKIIIKNNNYYAIIAGHDKKLVMYDINKRKIYKQYYLDFGVDYIAISNKHIAISGDNNRIHIFNYNLEKIKTINNITLAHGIVYNKIGTKLLVGSNNSGIRLYEVKSNYKFIKRFQNSYGFMLPAFLNDNSVIGAGGEKFGIYFFNYITGKVKNKIEGSGNIVWGVGIKNKQVGYSNEWSSNKNTKIIKKTIDLKKLKIMKDNQNFNFKKISSINGYKTLTIDKKNKSILKIQDYGKITGKIVKDYTNGKYHDCYGWYKNYIISGGINGFLKIYNIKGQEIVNLIGHTGDITSISIDGSLMVSASSDKTIKLWDLSKISNLINQLDNELISKIMKDYNCSRQKVIDIAKIKNFNLYRIPSLNPQLNIFIANDNEYIVWTEEGFFDASKNGSKYIGYHINQGSNKEAEYVTIDALYKTFYRPDLIQKALEGKDLSKYAKNISINKLLKDGLAPEVHILTKTKNIKTQDMNLKVQVCPKYKGGYDNLTLLINDIPVSIISTSRALKLKRKSKRADCFIYNKTISLLFGKNIIGFKATNKSGNIESKPDFLEVTFDNINPNKKIRKKLSNIVSNQNINDLHILAIAVNEYKDSDLKLKYSINDATQMLKTIQNVSKQLFNKVYTYKLFNKDVTKQNIENIFKTIKSKREDVFLLYIAGHGITDKYNGNYYYIPYDFIFNNNKEAIQKQGVGQRDLMLGLSKITALKSLVLLDTCNSGSFVEASVQKTTTNKLAKATGRATISASSKLQVALEGYKGHGAFTYTLIEALKGKGYKNDNKITVNELYDYVEDILPKLTNKKWGYNQIPQSSMYGTNFNIGKK